MTDQTRPRPWWRLSRMRLSLRAMMFLVMVFAIWFGRYVISVRVQRDAVAAIKTAGGSVAYDWEWGTPYNPNIIDPNGKPRVPKWLANLIGVDYVANVVSVNLVDSKRQRPEQGRRRNAGSRWAISADWKT